MYQPCNKYEFLRPVSCIMNAVNVECGTPDSPYTDPPPKPPLMLRRSPDRHTTSLLLVMLIPVLFIIFNFL